MVLQESQWKWSSISVAGLTPSAVRIEHTRSWLLHSVSERTLIKYSLLLLSLSLYFLHISYFLNNSTDGVLVSEWELRRSRNLIRVLNVSLSRRSPTFPWRSNTYDSGSVPVRSSKIIFVSRSRLCLSRYRTGVPPCRRSSTSFGHSWTKSPVSVLTNSGSPKLLLVFSSHYVLESLLGRFGL